MNASEIASYGIGLVGILIGVILHLRAQGQLKDQQISTLKSTANLAGDTAAANEAEKESNDSEKTYDNLRDKLLANTTADGKPNSDPHTEGDL